MDKEKQSLTVSDLQDGLSKIKEVLCYWENIILVDAALEEFSFNNDQIKEFYHFLASLTSIVEIITSEMIVSLKALFKYFPVMPLPFCNLTTKMMNT